MKRIAMTLGALLTVGVAAAGEPGHLGHDHHASPPAADQARRGASVYQVDSVFVDDTGARTALDAGRGHPVIVTMFYASCTDACPLLIESIRRIEAAVPDSVRSDLRVLLVTFDPAHDTPAVMRALAEAHRVDRARWRFLAGSEDAVREVAAVLGIRYRRLSSGAFNHSSVITLLDRDGVAQARIDGIGQPTTSIVERLTSPSRATR